jgi:hypothetical protein
MRYTIYDIWIRKSPVILKKFGLLYMPVQLNTVLTSSGVESVVWSSKELDERLGAVTEPQIDKKKLNTVTFDEFVHGRPKELFIKICPLKVKNPSLALVSR